MKKFFNYLILGVFLLQGCDDFLNIQPKGYTIPSKYDDYRQLMNDAQLMAKALDHYPVFLTDDAQLGSGDELNNYTSKNDNIKYLYSFAHGPIFNDGQSDNIWHNSYKRIYVCNTVINNVMKVTDASEADKRNLRAEAMVARAFEYLAMIGCYAPAYDAATAATDYGLPLIFKEDVSNISYTRSSVEEVYMQIKKDLDDALPDLLDQVPNSFRPAKNVAYGFLARMYLMRGEYDKALENAKLALGVSEELVDLTKYTAKQNSYIGRIVLKEDMKTPYPEGMNNPENIYARYAPTVFELQVDVFASEDLLAVYAKDLDPGAVDKRRELWYSDDEFNSDAFPGYSVFCQYIRANLALNNMEVILTAAECYARAGGADNLREAARLYNLLRDHRIENNVHATFSDAEDALRKVLDERRREFAFLGTFRLLDLKRLNKDPRFAKTITHTAEGQTWTLPPNDNRYIFPLPPMVKEFQPNLPDYER